MVSHFPGCPRFLGGREPGLALGCKGKHLGTNMFEIRVNVGVLCNFNFAG